MSNNANANVSADRAAIVAKLTSRKFWAAVVGIVTAILTAVNVPASSAAQITAIIMAGATVIAYIVGEGLVDAAAVSPTEDTTPPAATPQEVVSDPNKVAE